MFKLLVFVLMLCILINLFRGLFFLVKDQGKAKRTANSLKWRVIFSIALVVVLIVGYFTDQIAPHSLPQVKETSSTVSE